MKIMAVLVHHSNFSKFGSYVKYLSTFLALLGFLLNGMFQTSSNSC